MKRIEKLRQVALDHKHYVDEDEFFYLFYKRYTENESESEHARYADAFNYALTNSFGFGGHNASLIFKKYEVKS